MMKLYWRAGQVIDESEAVLSYADIGVTRGYGIFDFLRTYGRRTFYLEAHLDRFFSGAMATDLKPPYTKKELMIAVEDLVNKHPEANLGIKLFLTGGISADGFMVTGEPTFWMVAYPLAQPPSSVKLKTVVATRSLPDVKSTNYMEGAMWVKRYKQMGFDDIIYKSKEGGLTESSTSNLFFVKDQTLVTADQGVLMGITRHLVLKTAKDVVKVEFRQVHESELSSFSECFITSTTKEICPVSRIDHKEFSLSHNLVTRQLKRLFEGLK